MKETIRSYISAECPWRDTLHWYSQTDSTNTQAKLLAKQGAAEGTVLIAGNQTAGRGRMGRSFQSPEGMGVYLSVILRPNCPPRQLMHLTCAAGVAIARAVEKVSGIRPQMKWINDLVLNGKKLGGILTEMSFHGDLVDYAVVGIGINCLQEENDFPHEIAGMATSLSLAAGRPVEPARLAAAMTEALWDMRRVLFTEKGSRMAEYKANCVTLGKDVQVLRQRDIFPAKALDIDPDGGLIVQYPDGTTESVSSGEVSVRGLYGYV